MSKDFKDCLKFWSMVIAISVAYHVTQGMAYHKPINLADIFHFCPQATPLVFILLLLPRISDCGWKTPEKRASCFQLAGLFFFCFVITGLFYMLARLSAQVEPVLLLRAIQGLSFSTIPFLLCQGIAWQTMHAAKKQTILENRLLSEAEENSAQVATTTQSNQQPVVQTLMVGR